MHIIHYYHDQNEKIASYDRFEVSIHDSPIDKKSRLYAQETNVFNEQELKTCLTDRDSFMLAIESSHYNRDTNLFAVEISDPNENYVILASSVEKLIELFQAHRAANFDEGFYDDAEENESWSKELDAMIELFRADPTVAACVSRDYDTIQMFPVVCTRQYPPLKLDAAA
jgi:hypothetical protein